MPEQTRLHVVFGADFRDATVTTEIWRNGERIACHVGPLEDVTDSELLVAALERAGHDLPRLF